MPRQAVWATPRALRCIPKSRGAAAGSFERHPQALVLTEAAPDRANALLERGRSFGQSRAICGVHWKSDIEAGRLMGAATVARLQANAVFQAQLAAARKEIVAARAAGEVPSAAECAAETQVEQSSARIAP